MKMEYKSKQKVHFLITSIVTSFGSTIVAFLFKLKGIQKNNRAVNNCVNNLGANEAYWKKQIKNWSQICKRVNVILTE